LSIVDFFGEELHRPERHLDRSRVHSYCATVKNITVSVDDDLYHAARVAAAQKKTNVTAVLRAYLTAFVEGKAPLIEEADPDEGRKEREELVAALKECNLVLGYRPSREKTYER
jgi:hypothetical protein